MQLVHLSGDRLIVTSREISNHFGKRHDDVLKAIKNLDCSREFRLRNFAESVYHNQQNKPQPLYELTRDGFTFLCMGFTGPQAALWKERYIDAFNQMEAALRGPAPALAVAKEAGQLRDQLARCEGEVVRLTRQLLLAKDREIRSLKLRAAEETQRRIDRVIALEAAGRPRAEIAANTGLAFNYIRQIIFRARRDGHLGQDVTPESTQGQLALDGVAA